MIKDFTYISVLLLGLLSLGCSACRRPSVPKPYGYVRLAVPDTAYRAYTGSVPFAFDLSRNAELALRREEGSCWVDIRYPSLGTTLHGTYFPVRQNLDELTDDAVQLVYKHVAQATAIPEQAFENPERSVYGVLFRLQGNTASPYQFFLTDSVHHFFRGSVYCECRPNADSLAPVYDYLEQDIRRLIESWQWVK